MGTPGEKSSSQPEKAGKEGEGEKAAGGDGKGKTQTELEVTEKGLGLRSHAASDSSGKMIDTTGGAASASSPPTERTIVTIEVSVETAKRLNDVRTLRTDIASLEAQEKGVKAELLDKRAKLNHNLIELACSMPTTTTNK